MPDLGHDALDEQPISAIPSTSPPPATPPLFLVVSLSGLGSGGPFFHDRLSTA